MIADTCEYSLEKKADFQLAEWMHVTGYQPSEIVALSDEMLEAIHNVAFSMGAEFHSTNNESVDNPFIEYVELTEKEYYRRNNHVI